MKRILFLDCFSGISGDMTLSALLHLGVPLEVVSQAVAAVAPPGVRLQPQLVEICAIQGIRTDVILEHPSKEHMTYSRLTSLLGSSSLPSPVRDMALHIFEVLAEAEGHVHGVPPANVHFHEVGAWDSIADIVGVSAAIHHLDVAEIVASPPALGSGFVETRHGPMPLPAPATVEILRDVPVRGTTLPFELTTPTGAAVLKALAKSFGPMPAGRVLRCGYGAGHWDLPDRPDLLRAVLLEEIEDSDGCDEPSAAKREASSNHGLHASSGVGELTVGHADSGAASGEWELTANIDDSTPEVLGRASTLLLESGALDVWMTPVYMKKNRPGVQLSVLCQAVDKERLKAILFQETSAIGVRETRVVRTTLDREVVTVRTSFGRVRVKVARLNGRVVNVAPEFEDIARISSRTARPAKDLLPLVIAQVIAELSASSP